MSEMSCPQGDICFRRNLYEVVWKVTSVAGVNSSRFYSLSRHPSWGNEVTACHECQAHVSRIDSSSARQIFRWHLST